MIRPVSSLVAGAARVDITPPNPVPLAGYPPITLYEGGPPDHRGYIGRVGPSDGVHDAVYARAVAIGETSSDPLIVVALDLCLLPRSFTERVRAAAGERWGLAPDTILLAASHTHSAPDWFGYWEEVDATIEDFLLEATLRAIREAVDRRAPAEIGWSRGALLEPVVNRRDRMRPIDPEVAVLRVDNRAGEPVAVAFNFACHPIVVGDQNRQISADFPGYASSLLEHALGPSTVALFLNGAAGNINPAAFPYGNRENIATRSRAAKSREEAARVRSHAEARRLGNMLGAEVLKVASMIETRPAQYIASRARRVLLPLKPRDQLEVYFRHTNLQERWRQMQRDQTEITSEVSAFVIGDRVLLSLPAEPFVEIGLDLKRLVQQYGMSAVVVGYANDYTGYLLREEDYLENRYETIATPLSPSGARLLLEASQEVWSHLTIA